MKKTLGFVGSFIGIFVLVFISLYGVNSYYDKKLERSYSDQIGDSYADVTKDSGLSLQQQSVNRPDNVLIYGSSELGSLIKPFHPAYFFENKRTGFQPNIIGRGYSQSLVHGINFGALGKELSNKKVVFIISPQWFDKEGLSSSNFMMNFSDLQFYAFVYNHDITKDLKLKTINRIEGLISGAHDKNDIKLYCYLSSKNNFISNVGLKLFEPYFKIKYYYLEIKDKKAAYDDLAKLKATPSNSSSENSTINWTDELKKAADEGKEQASNNNMGFENVYYTEYIKDKLASYKGVCKNASYLTSPEYDDLSLLLDICKEENIKPLFVSVPVNGVWYDYEEFPKSDRNEYYKKVRNMITSYGFEIADFSDKEYEAYFLKDSMHLGWKGWVYVNEAIDKYYHENR